MIVYLKDGKRLRGSPLTYVHGLQAVAIEMEAGDFQTLLNLSERDPEQFRVTMVQLDARFVGSREICPACAGSGELSPQSDLGELFNILGRSARCPKCGGSGGTYK